jgi:hypothetical protein
MPDLACCTKKEKGRNVGLLMVYSVTLSVAQVTQYGEVVRWWRIVLGGEGTVRILMRFATNPMAYA